MKGELAPETLWTAWPGEFENEKSRRKSAWKMRGRNKGDDRYTGFWCMGCHQYVPAAVMFSGVQNRNHCPYCLRSRHLDLYEAGDRLAACKAVMSPVGLTVKKTAKKYGQAQGELMLIHVCVDCGKVSINRIAADDDAQRILELFEDSLQLDAPIRRRLAKSGVGTLRATDLALVRARLFGRN
ncbi:MAG: RNHCP domain-containing protein [Chloroflexota bacterium]